MAAYLCHDDDLRQGQEVSVNFELEEVSSCQSSLTRRRRDKIIHPGYSDEERKDTRREAIRQFFLSIPLDSEIESSEQSDILQLTGLQALLIDMGSPQITQANPFSNALQFNRGHDVSLSSESPRQSKRKKHNTSLLQYTKRLSLGVPSCVHPSISVLRAYAAEPEDGRVAFVYKGYPAVYYSLIPYCKPEKRFRSDLSSAGRVRTNSVSVQLELDEIDLCDPTKEVSLAHLLEPIWTSSEKIDKQILTPPTRGGSTKRTPAVLVHQSSLRDVGHQTPTHDTKLHLWQSFKDYHSPHYVIIHYEPDCLDNSEYFKGRKVTTLNLPSYRVSFCKYARESEVKKEINDQFNEMFPYIKLTISKLRSIKKDMITVGLECDLDPVAVAHALVYFEKLVLIGKVNKTTRKLVAGSSLLLAAKFYCDWKRQSIKNLIEEIIEKFKCSQKELLSYEFPTLVALDFSLLTPVHQVKLHYDKISSSIND